MTHHRLLPLAALAITAAGLSVSADADATAMLGGTISLTMVPGLGACNATVQVLGTTLQDTFTLSAMTPPAAGCAGQSASGSMHAEAATRSIGLTLAASGPQTVAAAQVSFMDQWIITPAAGTPAGFIPIPVSFQLEGSVAPGSVFDPGFGRFMSYVFTISDQNSGAGSPQQSFQAIGQITATGNVLLSFNGVVSFRNFNQSTLPMTAIVEMSLFVPHLDRGAINFYNTAQTSLTLPPGFSATTSSGIPLVFAPVPEPAGAALWALGLVAVGLASRRRGC